MQKNSPKTWIRGINKMEIIICSSVERSVLTIDKNLTFIYIPLTEDEKLFFKTTIENACFRIKVLNNN